MALLDLGRPVARGPCTKGEVMRWLALTMFLSVWIGAAARSAEPCGTLCQTQLRARLRLRLATLESLSLNTGQREAILALQAEVRQIRDQLFVLALRDRSPDGGGVPVGPREYSGEFRGQLRGLEVPYGLPYSGGPRACPTCPDVETLRVRPSAGPVYPSGPSAGAPGRAVRVRY